MVESFIFLVVKVDLPSTPQTVLLRYCKRSGVAERRLHMTTVFCCVCWWLCCVRCCGFCVLQILFCRVLSLPLTLKISQTCSLVYTVNIRKYPHCCCNRYDTPSSAKRYVPKGTKPKHLRPKPHKNIKQNISEKMDYPKKRKQETCTAVLTHREPTLLLKCRSQ